MKHIRGLLTVALSITAFSALTFGADRPELIQKAQTSATVLKELVSVSDKGIPLSLLRKAVCVATLPDVISGGVIFGARFGRGLVSCRTDATHWSNPSYVTVAGGSWGIQIGIESIDLILVFVNANAVERFSHDNFTIGGDASVAAGPIGRNAQAGTDYKLDSEIYSYSRSRGLFAGLTFSGSVLAVDRESNAMTYNNSLSAHDLLTTPAVKMANSPLVYAQALGMYVK